MTNAEDRDGGRSPEELREEVERELDEMTDRAAQEEEDDRLAERERTGVDEPSDR